MGAMNTTPEDLDIIEMTPKGNTYKVAVYVDPFPGRKGSDRIRETCGKCSGDKVIHYGNVTLRANGVEGRVCFECNGLGYTSRLVSTARSTARRQAKAETARRAEAADWEAEAPARAAAELEQAHEEALTEEARRNALPKGFIGEVGERLRNLNAQVKTIRYFETVGHYGQPTSKCIIIFEVLGGRMAKWVTDWSQGTEEGQFVSLTGTVKAHDNYKGTDQTVLTRCILK